MTLPNPRGASPPGDLHTAAPAPATPPDLSRAVTWIVTDGKAGDENQCVGIAEALGLPFAVRRIPRGRPFGWTAPWGPVDPRDAPGRPGGALAGRLPYTSHVEIGRAS